MNGTLIIKIRGRDEAYWILTFAALVLAWTLGPEALGVGSNVLVPAVMAIFLAVRFALLRNWNVRRTTWSADRDSVTVDGRTLLRKDITGMEFRPNRTYSGSWFLNIRADKVIRLECLATPESLRKESLDSLKALAIAIDPMLTEHPECFPD